MRWPGSFVSAESPGSPPCSCTDPVPGSRDYRHQLKDVSLATRELHVRGGKGGKDRTTVIADAAVPLLREQVAAVEELHVRDLERGGGWAALPGALHRKDPRAGWDLGWQYLFPASVTSVDEKTGRVGRWHLHASAVQRALKRAAREAKVTRPICAHVLRHCFATELLRAGCDVRLLQRLMGHRDLNTTALYLHILDRPGVGIISPLDRLPVESQRRLTNRESPRDDPADP